MKSIPRLVAGTAVVLAAVLTTSPVTAGIADYILNPGQQPTKRAAPALTGPRTPPVGTTGTREDDKHQIVLGGAEANSDDGADPATASAALSTTAQQLAEPGLPSEPRQPVVGGESMLADTAGLVAQTAADAHERVTDLASDLQSGVEAGEYSQADADRVLGEISSYIKGERTWPERSAA